MNRRNLYKEVIESISINLNNLQMYLSTIVTVINAIFKFKQFLPVNYTSVMKKKQSYCYFSSIKAKGKYSEFYRMFKYLCSLIVHIMQHNKQEISC